MKILLIGRTGQLGSHIIKNNKKYEIHAPGREELDLENLVEKTDYILGNNFDVIINAAAFHNVLLCEKEYDKAFRVNCAAVRDLAAFSRETGARLVTFSSDYVFSGQKSTPYMEDDKPCPLQMYGITRASGEFIGRSVAPENVFIIRTCGLYGLTGASAKGGNFVDKRVKDAKNNESLEMNCEQIVSPTYAEDLSIAVLKLIENENAEPGIYHLVNEGACSWFEFTEKIYGIMDIRIKLVPVNRRGMEKGMRRPIYSVLANTRAKKLGIILPEWQDALKRYLADKYSGGSDA